MLQELGCGFTCCKCQTIMKRREGIECLPFCVVAVIEELGIKKNSTN